MPRRELDLTSLDAVVAEAQSLHRTGYTKGGQWDLGQVCTHIGGPLHGVAEGTVGKVKPPWFVKLLVRVLLVKCRALRTRRIRSGVRIPQHMVPPAGLDEAKAIADLAAAAKSYQAYQGTMPKHPLFGALTRQEWDELIVIHASHHLGFLYPKEAR